MLFWCQKLWPYLRKSTWGEIYFSEARPLLVGLEGFRWIQMNMFTFAYIYMYTYVFIISLVL